MTLFDELNKKHFPAIASKLEDYAKENHVPIIIKDSLMVIFSLLDAINAKNILEIGTAIGYSSICMANYTHAHVDTIERNDEMYSLAIKNIKEANLEDLITVHHADALEIDLNNLGHYDLIFIDAAKAQNIKFFEKFSPLLNKKGIIITDNLFFHGAVEGGIELTKNVTKLAEKIKKYNDYLSSLENYHTVFIPIGDGISVTWRNEE